MTLSDTHLTSVWQIFQHLVDGTFQWDPIFGPATTLLQRMLCIDPAQRATLSEVRPRMPSHSCVQLITSPPQVQAHPWYSGLSVLGTTKISGNALEQQLAAAQFCESAVRGSSHPDGAVSTYRPPER